MTVVSEVGMMGSGEGMGLSMNNRQTLEDHGGCVH